MKLEDHSLIAILKTLSNAEIKELNDFLSSPFHNKLVKVIELFSIIKKSHPEYKSEKLNTIELFKKLYPGKEYKHSTITNLISKLQKLTENFLVITNIQKNSFKKNEFLIKEYFGRNLKNLSFKSIFTDSEGNETNNETIDSDYFYNSYTYDTYRVNYIVNYGMDNNKKSNEIFSSSLLKASANFVNYFIMEFISNYINSVIMLSSNDTKDIKPKLDKIINDLNIESFINNTESFNSHSYILNLYLKLVQAFSNMDNIEYYFSYKKELLSSIDKLNGDEIYIHYSKLISYCSLKKEKKSEYDFQKEMFDICQLVLKNEYYINFTSKFLPINLYRIILNNAISLGKYDWLRTFIEEYSKKVNPRLRKETEYFSLATLNFALGNYDECLRYLNLTRENVFILDIRAMKLIIFYNFSYFNEGLNDLKSFLKFIRINKTLTQQRRQNFINFLTYMDKLFLYKIANRKSEIGYYRKKLKTEESCVHKDWLLKTYQKIK